MTPEKNFHRAPKAPNGYRGIHISIDEMNPKFNDNRTVELDPVSISDAMRIGEIILLGSNKNPESQGYGIVEKIEGGKVFIKMLD